MPRVQFRQPALSFFAPSLEPCLPRGHCWHVDEAFSAVKYPFLHRVHAAWFLSDVKLPGAHATHVSFPPTLMEYLPGLHPAHSVDPVVLAVRHG